MNSDLKRTWTIAVAIVALLAVAMGAMALITRNPTPDTFQSSKSEPSARNVIASTVAKDTKHETHGLTKTAKASGMVPAGYRYTLRAVSATPAPRAVDADGQPYDQTDSNAADVELPVSSDITISHYDKKRTLRPDELTRMLRSIVVDQHARIVQHPTRRGFTIASDEIVARGVTVKGATVVIAGLFDREMCDAATGATVELKQACDFGIKLKDVRSP